MSREFIVLIRFAGEHLEKFVVEADVHGSRLSNFAGEFYPSGHSEEKEACSLLFLDLKVPRLSLKLMEELPISWREAINRNLEFWALLLLGLCVSGSLLVPSSAEMAKSENLLDMRFKMDLDHSEEE